MDGCCTTDEGTVLSSTRPSEIAMSDAPSTPTQPVSRADWEDALSGFLIEADARQADLPAPPVAEDADVKRRRASVR